MGRVLHSVLIFLSPPARTDLPEELRHSAQVLQARERILTTLLRVGALLGSLTFILSLSPVLEFGQPWLLVIYTLALASLWSVAVRRRLSMRVRGLVALILMYGLALTELISFGYTEDTITYLVAFSLYALIFFGWQVGACMLGLSAATLMLFGTLLSYGLFIPVVDPLKQLVAPYMVATCVLFVMVVGSVQAGLAVLLHSLERAWSTEYELRRTLEHERVLLEQRVNERTRELTAAQQEVQTASELLGQQRFMERVMAAIPSQVFLFDLREPRTIYRNRPPVELGYSVEDLQRLGPFPIAALMHPDDATRLPEMAQHQRTMRDDEVYANEFRVRHANGSWRWLASRDVVFARDADGRPVQILGASIDITALKQAQEHLAAAVQRIDALNDDLRRNTTLLNTIVNSLDDGLALIDEAGNVLLANEGLARLYQHALALMAGRHWSTVCPLTAPLVAQALREGTTTVGRFRITRPDATTITLDLRTFPFIGSGGDTEQVVLHLVDVTERLQLEALTIQNERLAASSRLAANIAHEVNSPLQAIHNSLFLVANDEPAEREHALLLLTEEIDRISGLVRRLLDLNRPDHGVYGRLVVNALLEKVLTLTMSRLKHQRVTVHRELADDLTAINGRGDQLLQVLFNLTVNALDAMPRGGKLTVRTLARAPVADDGLAAPLPQQVVVIEMQDSGNGLHSEVLPYLFTPFYTTKEHGSGLGLAISSQIVEQHGGRLLARNAVAGGAIFSVVLPATLS